MKSLPPKSLPSHFEASIDGRDKYQQELEKAFGENGTGDRLSADVELAEKKLAATLVNRKAKHLSGALEPLTGGDRCQLRFRDRRAGHDGVDDFAADAHFRVCVR